MNELEIAFDTKEKFEYFIKYIPLEYKDELIKGKRKKYYIFKKQDLVPKKLGTFLLDFLNTNFNIFTSFKNFILEYIFIYLFLKMHNNISINSILYDDKFNMWSTSYSTPAAVSSCFRPSKCSLHSSHRHSSRLGAPSPSS